MLNGELHYIVELRIERLVDDLEVVGFEARHLLPEEDRGGTIPKDIIEWHGSKGRGVVHGGAVEQLAIGLLDPAVWAQGLAASVQPPGPERRWGSYVCLAREDEVWR